MIEPTPKPSPPSSPSASSRRPWQWATDSLSAVWRWLADYFVGEDPTFWVAMVPLLIVAALLFTRHFSSNYIFDEQEALLANPYVNAKSLGFFDAVHRDFWGLPPDRSVGSYRPLPNFVWRGVWDAQKWITEGVNRLPQVASRSPVRPSPWHWVNVLLYAVHGTVVVGLLAAAIRKRSAKLAGGAALLTGVLGAEAVFGAAGVVYALAGLGAALALVALSIPLWGLPAGLWAAAIFTGISKIPPNPAPAAMQPWVFHWLNVLIHAANGAILVCFIFALTRRRGLSWLVGVIFVVSAVLTEAVSGVVGIADVMGGLGAALALLALRLPMWGMPFAVFGAVLIGLFSKESALVCVPLVPFAALVLAHLTHPSRPRRFPRALFALIAAVGALVLYVELRKWWFPAPLPPELKADLPEGTHLVKRAVHSFHGWFHQAPLPKDPLNNPLVKAEFPYRVAGALRVFWRGLVQVVFPRHLSGDYSHPQEPAPESLYEPESVLGGLAMVLLPLTSVVLWVRGWIQERRARRGLSASLGVARSRIPADIFRATVPKLGVLSAVGLMWVVVAYFPHSNIPVLLPTVRAERFWYFPVLGSSIALACVFAWLMERTRHRAHGAIAVGLVVAFLVFQSARARTHAFDYENDLVFWDATRHAVPNSAKAHLNYSVMWGARGRLDIRRDSNQVALGLAPTWPMAHVYLGDTLCRLHKPNDAWPHYRKGFELASGDPNLIALGLQCLWDEGAFDRYSDQLSTMAMEHPGSWLAFLVNDTVSNGKANHGVDPKYRPRGYNEGPKD